MLVRAVSVGSAKSMIRNRLFAVLVSFALSLQLVLAGAGVTCLAPSGAQASSRAGDDMAGMSGIDMTSSAGTSSASKNNSAPEERGSGSIPCERAPASTNCQLFASCAAGFVAADTRTNDAARVAPSTLRVIELLTPSSRTVAPELPPPRA